MKNKKIKIRSWDVETSLSIVTTFSLRNDYISPDNIIQDWNILCGSWKLLEEDKVHSVVVKEVQDDYEVTKTLRDMIEDTDILIHHNGKKFDLKKLNTRILKHGLPPLDKKLLQVDTYLEARKNFGFTSNKLDYIARYLEVGKKLPHSEGLWRAVLNGDKKALKEMVAYNKHDVVILEGVYNKMRPYIDHPNMGAFFHDDIEHCPNCGSNHLQRWGTRITATGLGYHRYRCVKCGSYSQGRKVDSKTLLK